MTGLNVWVEILNKAKSTAPPSNSGTCKTAAAPTNKINNKNNA